MPKEDVKFPEGNDPYKKEGQKPKDGMDFQVSKSPMEVGFGKDDQPLKHKDGPIDLP